MINKALLYLLMSILSVGVIQAQQFSFHKEIKFARYLQSNNQNTDAEWVLNHIEKQYLTTAELDSLNYEIGWLYYSNKKLDTAIQAFLQISKNETRYTKANFFAAYCLAFLKLYDSSTQILQQIKSTDSVEVELKNFQLAGIALLQKNNIAFTQFSSGFTFETYFLKQEEENFVKYGKAIFSHKKKSPLLAGILSSIVPGAGKWYAGKKKQAVGSFLPILSAGMLTLEAFNKGGFQSARFWLFGIAFSTFHIANIWGSTLAVQKKENEYDKVYENKILFDMHIPLRNFFN